MSQNHAIQKLVVEFQIDGQEAAWEMQNELSASYQYLVVKEMELLFDSLVGPDEMVIIDRLEINVGELEQLNELPELIRSRAREALERVINEARSSEDGSGEVSFAGEEGEIIQTRVHLTSRMADDIARLEFFLNYGLLPASGTREKISVLLERLLENKAGQLKALLQRLPSFKRLVEQLRPAQLERLLEISHDGNRDWLRLKEELLNAFPAIKEKKVWELLFGYNGDTGAFYDQVTRKIPATILLEFDEEKASPELTRRIQELAAAKTAALLRAAEPVSKTTTAAAKYGKGAQGRLPITQLFENLLSELDLLELPDARALAALPDAPEQMAALAEKRAAIKELVALLLQAAGEVADEYGTDDDEIPAYKIVAVLTLLKSLQQLLKAVQGKKDGTVSGSLPAAVPAAGPDAVPAASPAAVPTALDVLEEELKEAYNEKLKKATEQDEEFIPADEAIYIANAGLVLIAGYLPAYFENVGLMEDDVFTGEEARYRAARLLQYIATGTEEETEEHFMVLNKLLCGIPLAEPLPLELDVFEEDIEETEEMLTAFMSNWDKLKDSPVNTVRANFLLREGRLEKRENNWLLTVEKTSFDFLLDSLPVSFDTVKLPWMNGTIYVEW